VSGLASNGFLYTCMHVLGLGTLGLYYRTCTRQQHPGLCGTQSVQKRMSCQSVSQAQTVAADYHRVKEAGRVTAPRTFDALRTHIHSYCYASVLQRRNGPSAREAPAAPLSPRCCSPNSLHAPCQGARRKTSTSMRQPITLQNCRLDLQDFCSVHLLDIVTSSYALYKGHGYSTCGFMKHVYPSFSSCGGGLALSHALLDLSLAPAYRADPQS
jgi:hypothetical protein